MKLVHCFFIMAIVAMVAVDAVTKEYRSRKKIVSVRNFDRNDQKNYLEAEAACQAMDMELATFKTDIDTKFKEYGIPKLSTYNWVNAKRGDDGKYRWRTGEEVDPKLWKFNAKKTKECVCLVAGGIKDLDDVDCDRKISSYLCEYKADFFEKEAKKEAEKEE